MDLPIFIKTKILIIIWPFFVNTASEIIGVKDLRACSIVPGVLIVRDSATYQDSVLLNHEQIHFVQAKELGLPRYLWIYLREFVKNRVSNQLSSNNAYYQVALEQEAYLNQSDTGYITTRKKFAWKHYLSARKRKKILYIDRQLIEITNNDSTRLIMASTE